MLKTGWNVILVLLYVTASYAGDECSQTYYCYHNCGGPDEYGNYFPQVEACSLLQGGNYSLLSNPAGPNIDCKTTAPSNLCSGYKTVIVTDPSVQGTGSYSCRGPNQDSTNAASTVINVNCTQAFKSKIPVSQKKPTPQKTVKKSK